MATNSDGLHRLNGLSVGDATNAFEACFPWQPWAIAMSARRPFADIAHLEESAAADMDAIADTDVPTVSAGYPRIGVDSGEATQRGDWSRREEAGIHAGTAAARETLLAKSAEYERRFGQRFVIAAAGLTAEEILAFLEIRSAHGIEAETFVARQQMLLICRARLRAWLAESG
jgi:OHCU decarboxylase